MQDLVEELTGLLESKNMKLAVAESCTGGLLSTTLTHRPGASKIFDCGFVTYSNESKIKSLGIPAQFIETHGAVSAEVAELMARNLIEKSDADLTVSITGIAGPDGGTPSKPVGLVFFGYALKGGSSGSLSQNFPGKRNEIQTQAVVTALKHLITVLQKSESSSV